MKLPSLVAILVAALGCAAPPPPRDPAPILQVGASYPQFGCVDDQARFAPTDCRLPPPPAPRLSASRDEGTHGRKLYYLFARDRTAYLQCQQRVQPVGQVLVKEAWSAAPGGKPGAQGTSLTPIAGQYVHAGVKTGLFIMMKTGEEDSDQGWIYATTSADGKTLSAAGKIDSCMECHQRAPHDRLFGLTSCAAAK